MNSKSKSIGLGVYELSNQDVTRVVPEALAKGYRYFDTAIRYKNQETLAKVLEEELKKQKIPRDQVVVVSKLGHRCLGNLPKRIKKLAREEPSRKNEYTSQHLKLDLEKDWEKMLQEVIPNIQYLDLVLLHRPYHSEINREMWSKLVELQKKNQRLIRGIGVSNFRQNELEDIIGMGLGVPEYNQIEISPFSPRVELRQYCLEREIKIIGHSSLAKMKFNPSEFPILEDMAEKYQITLAQLLLKWSYDQGIQIIPRTSCLEHLQENINVKKLNFKLSENDFQKLEDKKIINNFLTHQEYGDK